jgi:hypothetical protein
LPGRAERVEREPLVGEELRLPPMISTLIDIRVPSGAVVAPAATCAGEHAWYSTRRS